MGWAEGLLGGFVARKGEVEKQNIREAELAAGRESRVYEALLSSPDPEIQSLAAAGLLESAQPRRKKGGIRGWLGEMAGSQTFQQLHGLINTPVPQGQPGPGTLAHTEYPTIATPPPSIAPMGTPANSLTEPGAPPPPNVPTTTPPAQGAPAGPTAQATTATQPTPRPQPRQIPATVGAPPPMGPRRVFPTPYDTAQAQAAGKARGDVEGEVAGLIAAGFTDQQARQMVKQTYDRRALAAGSQSIAGEVVGPDGRAMPAFGVFDRTTGQYLSPDTGQPMQNFRPRTTTGSTSFGQDREAISRELFNRPFSQLSQAEQTQVNREERTRMGQETYEKGIQGGQAKIQTELNSPIGPTAAAQWNVSPTTTLGEMRGLVGLRPEQHDRVYALSQIDVSLDEIEKLLPKVFPAVSEGFGGAMKSAMSIAMQRLARDGDLAALDAALEGSLAQIAQLSGQPGSRLSDTDLQIARAQIANLTPSLFGGDTIITAKARLDIVRKLFEKAQASIPTAPPRLATPPPGGPQAAAPGSPPPSRLNAPAGIATVDADGNLVYK